MEQFIFWGFIVAVVVLLMLGVYVILAGVSVGSSRAQRRKSRRSSGQVEEFYDEFYNR